MRNLCFILFSILFVCTNVLQSQDRGNYGYNNPNRPQQNIQQNPPPNALLNFPNQANPNTPIIFNVSALINEKADAHLAIFNITQVGMRAGQADTLVNERFEKFKKEAIRQGIKKDQIYIDMLSLVPVYEVEVHRKFFSKTYNEIPAGFELVKNIHVVYKDAKILDRLVSIAAKYEIYDLVKVEYFVEDTEKTYDRLRDRSVELVKKKMASLKKMGIELDTVYRVFAEQKNVSFPIERYRNLQSYKGASLEAVKNKKRLSIAPKQTTTFYEKLPYNGYDIVINPVILEPAVQYTYNMKVQFFVKPPPPPPPQVQIKTVTQKELIWLTEKGEMKSMIVE